MIKISDITKVPEFISDMKVVIFDLDDTLYSEKEYIRSGYKQVATSFSEIPNMERRLWDAFCRGGLVFDVVLDEVGMLTEENLNKCLKMYRYQIPDIHLYAGVKEMLQYLKDIGIHLGIITDGRPEGQQAKIQVLNLEKYIDYIIITDNLGGVQYRKPCEIAFQKMREYFNTKYSEMCYVGDNIQKDFIAPKKLGMKSIWVQNQDGLYQ